jgi:alcohol dehydrogenase (cytochrome c)
VLWRFADGEIADVRFGELMRMLRPRSGFWLEPLLDGMGLSSVVDNPFDTRESVATGAQIYYRHCSSCHGADANGGSAPALRNRAQLKHGSSDWAIYRTVTDGIRGTAMVPSGLAFDDTWRTIAYIESLGTEGAVAGGAKRAGSASSLWADFKDVTYDELLHASRDSREWRTYSRTYDGHRFSPLSEINVTNVRKLRVRWVRQLSAVDTMIEATPIVVNGAMFVTQPPNDVLALDAANGEVLWTYHRAFSEYLALCCGKLNRGVAALNDRVYVGTLDGHLIALNAKTGRVVWNKKLAAPEDGYSITGAPLAVRDMIVTGVSGGEFGIRGFLHAADARTGETRWRFYTIPGPGEAGNDSWSGESWRTGGGPTWVTGSFDPSLNLIYWGVGNPNPNFDGDDRKGDNLYTNSVVALDATTGRLVWHFQFTPHDEHDWDSNQVPVLATIKRDGGEIPVIAWANRNGFYYVLDRRNGRFLAGVPFVKQSWAKGLDPSGRPILTATARPSVGGTLIYPGVSGATNWQSPAFDPKLGLFFVHADESGSIFSKADNDGIKRRPYEQFLASGARTSDPRNTYVRALKIATGERVWQYQSMKDQRAWWSGLLATAGGLVFGGAGERAFALDARTGKELWSFNAGGGILQGPIAYSEHGREVVVFIAGRSLIAFSL